MRIGHSFDTNHDLVSFRRYEERFGVGEVLLIKRHPWFFITGLPYFFYSILLLVGTALLVDRSLISISPLFFYVHAIVFLVIIGANFFLLAAHISSSSDLPISNFFSYAALEHKKDKTFRFRMLLFFGLYVIAVGLLIAAMLEGWLLAFIDSPWDILLLAGHSLAQLFMLYRMTRIIAIYVNYEMDHIIITPEFIEIIDQRGLFHQHNRVINWDTVFSFEIVKKGFFASIMNIGKLLILGEPFTGNKNIMTTFMYVAEPELIENAIHTIVDRRKNG